MAGWADALASWLRRWVGWLLLQSWLFGDVPMVPRHVGFIMDGNRRFADREGMPTQSGHSRGYDKAGAHPLGQPPTRKHAWS